MTNKVPGQNIPNGAALRPHQANSAIQLIYLSSVHFSGLLAMAHNLFAGDI